VNAPAPEDAAGVIALARKIDLIVTEQQAAQLEAFAAMLKKWNRAFNLLSRKDIGRLWSRHILDALSVSSLLAGGRILDFGTGGGFPGVPLAVVNPQREFVLLDRHQRKCRFLDQVVHTLALTNTTVVCGQAAELVESLGQFDSITSRAVAPAPEVWDQAAGLLTPGGRIIVMAATGQAEFKAPAGSRCARRHIPGLEAPHEVVIMEAGDCVGKSPENLRDTSG
jgi:16S rRNA (guanine527-N7)-methyltransferase